MGALRKYQASRADSDWRVNKDDDRRASQDSDFRVRKAQKTFAGYIFICNNSTMPADLKRKIFGLPANHLESVQCIQKGMPLFLYNYSTRLLHGIFEAASDGGCNIDPYAWEYAEVGRHSNPISKYPAQVRVLLQTERPPLDEDVFRPVLDHMDGMKFKLELTSRQVQELLHLFGAPGLFKRYCSSDWHRSYHFSFANHSHDSETSTRFCFRSDTSRCNERSSNRTSVCEDGWVDEYLYENKLVVESGYHWIDNEGDLCQELSEITLNDINICDSSERDLNIDVPCDPVLTPGENELENDQFNHSVNEHGPDCECATQSSVRWSSSEEVPQTMSENLVLLRFVDMDLAVNGNSVTWIEADIKGPKTMNDENAGTLPVITAELESPFIADRDKMIVVPVQAVSCKTREAYLVPEWSELEKHSWSQFSRKHAQDRHSSTICSKLCRERIDYGDQVLNSSYSIQRRELQISRVLVPIEGLIPEQGNTPTLLSPLIMPADREGMALAVSPMNLRINDSEGIEALCNGGPPLPEGPQPVLHGGRCPIVFMPSVIPRATPNPPFTDGFIQGLHFDILHFAKVTRPSSDIQHYVEAAIACVRKGIKILWPEADVEIFGSFATGLCLQHSDVDLAVIDAPRLSTSEKLTIAQVSPLLIRELATVLKTYEWCESINALDTATVPVLKCRCRLFPAPKDCDTLVPSIAIDITIGNLRDSNVWSPYSGITDADDDIYKPKNFSIRHTGGAAREYVLRKIQELPALAPLVLLLKSYLHHKNLSNVYLGGLGSFSLTLLVAFYLERVPIPRGVLPEMIPSDTPISPTLSLTSPLTCSSEFSDDSDTQSLTSGNGSCSSHAMSDSNILGLGGHYVKRAVEVIDTVLSRWSIGGSPYLGILLLGFLQTFGVQLDLSSQKIVLKGPNGEGGLFKRNDRHVALWIDDPLRPGVNVGAGSFAMNHVQMAFKDMFQVLTRRQMVAPLYCDESDCQDLAAMGHLSHLSLLILEADNR